MRMGKDALNNFVNQKKDALNNFVNQKKKSSINKTISELINEKGNHISEQSKILFEQEIVFIQSFMCR